VPVISPASATVLSNLASLLAAEDGGIVIPVSVVAPGADGDHVSAAAQVLHIAEDTVASTGVRVSGLLAHHGSVAQAVIDALARSGATLVVMGWQGLAPHPAAAAATVEDEPSRVFGQIVGSVIGRGHTPLAVVRPADHPFDRILVPIAEEALLGGGLRGVGLAAELAGKLARATSSPVTLLRAGTARAPLPEHILGLSDRVHNDPRRVDRALAAAVRRDDLVVVAVDATPEGLRAATTHVAWAAPDAWLLLAVDAGHGREEDIAEAVRLAGSPPPPGPAEVAGRHEVVVTVGCRGERPSTGDLVGVLGVAGTVTDVSAWSDRRGRLWHQAALQVDGRTASAAVGTVMGLLARSEDFAHADITYEVHRPRVQP
jgi:hypothetical protein